MNSNSSHWFARKIFIPVFIALCGSLAVTKAQQTIFNVPTTDVLDKGKVYFELDISAKPNDSAELGRPASDH